MSLSSARRESDLPFMPSRLSRSRDLSLDERSRSLDDLDDEIVRDIQGRNASTSMQRTEIESKSVFVKSLIISSNCLKEFKMYDHMSVIFCLKPKRLYTCR